MAEQVKAQYEVLVGLDYPKGSKAVRAEAGEVKDDLPKQSLAWLLEHGYIKEVS